MENTHEAITRAIIPMQTVIQQLRNLLNELGAYAEGRDMGVGFFMENFLQVDIFYKDMSYEKSSQQATFSATSLLGEMGGFMELLLGASGLTVCELLDYIMLKVMVALSIRRKAKPVIPTSSSKTT